MAKISKFFVLVVFLSACLPTWAAGSVDNWRSEVDRLMEQGEFAQATKLMKRLPKKVRNAEVVTIDSLNQIIDETHPDEVSIEKLFFNQNITTGISVAEARGVVILVARQHNLPIYEYTPLQIKQTLTGYGKADKKQMQESVRQYLNMRDIVKPDDAADALAAAITHALMTRAQYDLK